MEVNEKFSPGNCGKSWEKKRDSKYDKIMILKFDFWAPNWLRIKIQKVMETRT